MSDPKSDASPLDDEGRDDDGTSIESVIERKCVPFEVKAVSSDGFGSFQGLANAFNNIDEVGDITAPGAFAQDLTEFLAKGFIGGINHDWDCPIGHPASANETPDGLLIKAVFDGSPEAQSVRAAMTPHADTGRATVRHLSIGYKCESRMLNGLDEIRAYWSSVGYTPTAQDLARANGSVRLLTRIKLIEVSPVMQPANTLSAVASVKGLESKSFIEHSLNVASAVRETRKGLGAFIERAEARVEARLKAGRELSEANWQTLKDLHDEHESLCGMHSGLRDRLKALLERTKRCKDDDECEPETGKPFEVDEAAVLTAYAEVMTATNPAMR